MKNFKILCFILVILSLTCNYIRRKTKIKSSKDPFIIRTMYDGKVNRIDCVNEKFRSDSEVMEL